MGQKIIISLSIDQTLLQRVDAAAKAEYTSRSDFMRMSLVARLKALEQPVELVIPKAGEPLRKLYQTVRKLNFQAQIKHRDKWQ